MRQQYFFRPSPRGFFAWDVFRLIELTAAYPRRLVPLSEIREVREPWFGPDEPGAWAALVEHVKLADLRYPIILAADGSVMDGMPDFVDSQPQDLPYDGMPRS